MDKPPIRNPTKGGKTWEPRFIEQLAAEKCTRCGFCPKVCPAGVLRRLPDGSVVIAEPDDCRGCQVCQHTCKAGAITCGGSGEQP